jgi:D-alanine transaminase
MSIFAYYNGVFGSFDEIRIPLSDRAVFFGDGVYDAALAAGDKIYLLDRHIKRFLQNAKKLGIPVNFSEYEFEKLLRSVVSRCGFETSFVYFHLTRGLPERTHSSLGCQSSNLLITVKKCNIPSPTPMRLHIMEDLRYFYCDIKTLNLLPQTLYATEADSLGLDECVLHRNGIVTECSHSNISIVKDGILYTHPLSRLILPGITRESLLRVCENEGIPFKEIPFSLKELCEADGIIVTSTSRLACPAAVGTGNIGKCEISDRLCEILEKQFVEFSS